MPLVTQLGNQTMKLALKTPAPLPAGLFPEYRQDLISI